MPVAIRLDEGASIREVLGQWAHHVEEALRGHFPAMHVSRSEQEREFVLFLSDGGAARGEIVLRWDRAAPNELVIFPQAARAAETGRAHADALAFRVAVACVIAASALWLGAAIGFWKDFLDIAGLRGKVFVLLAAVSTWLLTTFGLAAAAYYVVARSHRAINAPRAERGREWLDAQLWPWLLGALHALQQRAREDQALARRLAV